MTYHPDEFIGEELCVKDAKNRSLIGLCGKVIDETKKSFTVLKNGEEKIILKQDCTFAIAGKEIIGNEILQRGEERIKPRH